jgi:cytochrome c peroxidase
MMPVVSARGSRRALGVGLMAALMACAAASAVSQETSLQQRAAARFGVLDAPEAAALAAPDVTLGRRLFWDERLSLDGQTSCASCHAAEDWGADSRRFSRDARGALTGRHSQTVFNAMGQFALRWLGDRPHGAAQAERSITGSMGLADAGAIVPLLVASGYEEAFARAFPDDRQPVSSTNYGRAIEAYLRTLVTPAPFDAFLAGDASALTEAQRAGLELFMQAGCGTCHDGPRLGGTSFRKFGMTADYWPATGSDPADPGRYAVTKDERDRYVFRTPMLRNIARTAPYFHDGSVATLPEAVRVMARVQTGRELSDEHVTLIVAFLESLTGPVPSHHSPPQP